MPPRSQAALATSRPSTLSASDVAVPITVVESFAIVAHDAHVLLRLSLVEPSSLSSAVLCHIARLCACDANGAALQSVVDAAGVSQECATALAVLRCLLRGVCFLSDDAAELLGAVCAREVRVARPQQGDEVGVRCVVAADKAPDWCPSMFADLRRAPQLPALWMVWIAQ